MTKVFRPSSVREAYGLACPACGDDTDIRVWAQIELKLHPDGTEDLGGDQFWDNASPAECGRCGHSASVAAFDADDD